MMDQTTRRKTPGGLSLPPDLPKFRSAFAVFSNCCQRACQPRDFLQEEALDGPGAERCITGMRECTRVAVASWWIMPS